VKGRGKAQQLGCFIELALCGVEWVDVRGHGLLLILSKWNG
jgi:hypothetical protein